MTFHLKALRSTASCMHELGRRHGAWRALPRLVVFCGALAWALPGWCEEVKDYGKPGTARSISWSAISLITHAVDDDRSLQTDLKIAG